MITYRGEDLKKARELQKKCVELHLPCPPLATWKAVIHDNNGNVEEEIESKCNSYTRNGLNMIAEQCLFPHKAAVHCNPYGGDTLAYKMVAGNVGNACRGILRGCVGIILGTGAGEADMNAYALSSPVESVSSDTFTSTAKTTLFNTTTRRLTNTLQRTFVWDAEKVITEAGVFCQIKTIGSAESNILYIMTVRDVLEQPITVPANKGLTFFYNFELGYPE